MKTLLGDGQTSTVAAITAASVIGAPLLEEFTYRGFLLPSLTRWLPTPAAVSHTCYAFFSVESIYHYTSCSEGLLTCVAVTSSCVTLNMTGYQALLTSALSESGHSYQSNEDPAVLLTA